MKLRQALCFDDVLLEPRFSSICSRSDISLEFKLRNLSHTFSLPVFSSPMDTVTEDKMAYGMYRAGGLGIIHRYNTIDEQVVHVNSVCASKTAHVGAAIGVSGDFEERACAVYDAGARIICIDVAHGHHMLVKEALSCLRTTFGNNIHIMAGNVATIDGFNDLADWGADSIRVGIGGGSICSTRIQTGHGIPTLQSVFDCARSDRHVSIIADGGIRSSGDIVKCLAAGADAVICGSLLGRTSAAPGARFVDASGNEYKQYRGMASIEAQIDWRGHSSSVEGVTSNVMIQGTLDDVLAALERGIRSGLSYSGCTTLDKFRASARFINSSTLSSAENDTHIFTRK